MKRMFICLALVVCLLAGLAIGVSAETAKTINKIELGYTEPVVGQPLSGVTIPANANYTVEAQWFDYTFDGEYVDVGAIAEKGHIYDLEISVYPKSGYEFAYSMDVLVNGQTASEEDGFYVEQYGTDEIYIDTPSYALCDPIAEVRLTYTEPKVGQNFAAPVLTTKNCTLNDYSGWYANTFEDEANVTGKKVEKKQYYLTLALTADFGYKFTKDTKVYVNNVLQDLGAEDYYFSSGWMDIESISYDFRDKLSNVSITVADPVVGQSFPQAKTPSGANYEVTGYWYDCYDYESVTGKVEKCVYDLELWICPKDGYAFTEETVFTINGAEYYFDYYEEMGAVNHTIQYNLAQKVNQFSVNYTKPVVGQKPGAITIPSNANYTLTEESGWYDTEEWEKVTGKFENGKHYELKVNLKLKKGYSVGDEPQLLVNGVQSYNFDGDATELYFHDEANFCTPLSKIELPAWPEVKVGDRLSYQEGRGDHFEYYIYWATDDRTAKDGKLYYAYMEVYVDSGYTLTEDTKVFIGAEEVQDVNLWSYNYTGFEKYYNFNAVTEIDQIDLLTTIPAAGQAGGAVTVPENCGYSIENYAWGTYTKADYSDAQLKTDAYKKGEAMIVVAQLLVEEDYLVSSQCKVTLNGREYKLVDYYSDWETVYVAFDLGVVGEKEEAPAYNGLVVVDGVWGYYKDGVLQTEYTGLVEYEGIQFYVENGILDFNYTGLVWYNEAWTYVGNSQLTEGYTGLVWFEGEWFYVEDSVIDWTFTGLVPYNGNMFYVQNNHLDFTYTGLAYLNDGWYYVENALLKPDFTGLTYFNDNWFYVVDGTIDWTFTGMVPYNDNYFYVQNNLLDWSYTGLGYHDGAWYYFQNALYTPSFTGLVPFNGLLFYVKDGTIDWSFNGEAEYDGITYTVIAGLVTL